VVLDIVGSDAQVERLNRRSRQLGRNLQEFNTGAVKIDINDFMRFMLVRGEGASDEKLLRFSPSLSGFDGSSMEVQFDFENPLEVSTGDEPDKIVAFFTDPRLLMDPVTGMFVQNDGMVTEMPRQLMQTAATAMLQ
jgi:hypothetical protein